MHARHLKALRKGYAKRLQTTLKICACQAAAAGEFQVKPFPAGDAGVLQPVHYS
jgi:hypothetical protein